ncbi:hypothetical protein EBZ39_12985, partial [bacterium]|nr:hypothetical protein [bacterium]
MIATKRFLGLLTLVTLLGACGWIKSEESHFFDSTGKPLPALSAVLDATGIHHDGTRGDVIAKTQQAWLRPAGVERFNMTDPWAEKHDQIKPLCKQLGLIDPVMPAAKIYDIHKKEKKDYLDDGFTPNILAEPLPEYIGNKKLIPNETYVLVGYYKDETHLEWINGKR